MNLSIKWLNDYIKIDDSPRDFSEKLTMSGSKVEGYEVLGEEIQNVVIGKILSLEKHPDADKLVVCQVDVAKGEPIQIVTGATNVFEGAVIPVALSGSSLPNGIKIKKGKLRGVESNGMLCSLSELNLTTDDFPNAIDDGIFIIEQQCVIGQDIKEFLQLDDTIFEFEITSNRPDCLSIVGLAREVSATYGIDYKLNAPKISNQQGNVKDMLSVEVENKDLCKRYMAKVVTNVKVEPSPKWLRDRLKSCGVKPINNIVDITNYVMLEYNNPLHAFDYDKISGNKITVRNAKDNEIFETLDNQVTELSNEMLVISDEKNPVAIAGVIGGLDSGVCETTKTIIIESANFNGGSVRKTAKKLGKRTDSSARFEKGLNPDLCQNSLIRACELIEQLNCGTIISGEIDIKNYSKSKNIIDFNFEYINKFLGTSISKDEMIKMLKNLDFGIENDKITVPNFRIDIKHKADIAEEIARIYGYNNIPTTYPKGVANATLTPFQKFENKINNLMLQSGLYEIITYSFISPKYYDKINLDLDDVLRNSVKIQNPLGEDTSVMRTTTIPSMLEVLSKNFNNRNPECMVYEIGTEYIPVENKQLPKETKHLTIGMYGDDIDFYNIKGIIENLFENLKSDDFEIVTCNNNKTFHSGRCGKIVCNEKEIGILGEIHPMVAKNYNLGTKVYIAKLNIEDLFEMTKTQVKYKLLPKFPASTRDLSLICDRDLPVGEIKKVIIKNGGELIESVNLFDVYTGEQIEQDKKSVSYSIALRSSENTLTDEQCDNVVNKILNALKNINVNLRW